jgi:hypothetical protein
MTTAREAELAVEAFRSAVAGADASFAAVLQQRAGADERVSAVVGGLIGHLKTSDSLLISVLSGGPRTSSAAHAAVTAGILALRIGMELDYAYPELNQLGHVAVLHDIAGSGTPATHAGREQAVHRIRLLSPAYTTIADLIVQAHEALGGVDGARAARLHQDAKVVALAVTYDRLARQQPTGPRAWPPMPVKEILRRERTRFPDAILKAFIEISVQFPVGGLVRLNSGEVARVVEKNDGFPLRPVVLVAARGGKQPTEPRQVDLKDNPFLFVKEFLGHTAPDGEGT